MKKKVALYIHIPFCSKKCFYCGFNTFILKNIPEKQYLERLKADFNYYKNYFFNQDDISFSTIYVGGGTPNLLSNNFYSELFETIPTDGAEEITVELNPEFVTDEQISTLKKIGVNRFSLGVQTFSSKHLKNLNRNHSNEQTFNSIEIIKKYFNSKSDDFYNRLNFSVDLLYGYPQQTVNELKNDIEKLLSLDPQHVSIYNLTYEEGSFFHKWRGDKKISPLSEEIELEMSNIIFKNLKDNNYSRYEISNYSKKGFKSKHNSSYWNNTEYLGIGAGAHSYYSLNGELIRSYKETKRDKYLNLPIDKIEYREVLSNKEMIFDAIYTSFRKIEVNYKDFYNIFNFDLKIFLEKNFSDSFWSKYLILSQDKASFTEKGTLFSDSFFERVYEIVF